jgi:hypothetical protein
LVVCSGKIVEAFMTGYWIGAGIFVEGAFFSGQVFLEFSHTAEVGFDGLKCDFVYFAQTWPKMRG